MKQDTKGESTMSTNKVVQLDRYINSQVKIIHIPDSDGVSFRFTGILVTCKNLFYEVHHPGIGWVHFDDNDIASIDTTGKTICIELK